MTSPLATERPSEWRPELEEDFDSTHRIYSDVRAETPLPWSNDFGGFWSVFKYEDLVQVASDREGFVTSIQNTVPRIPRVEQRPPLHFDPPEHDSFRTPLNRVFRKSVIARRESAFREHARDILNELLPAGEGDLAGDFALQFALRCFAELLDLPPDRLVPVREIGIRFTFAIQNMDKAGIQQTSDELYAVAREVVAARSANMGDPETDLVSSLLAASETDPIVTYESIVASVRQFLASGFGGVTAVLSSIFVHLARDASLQQQLRGAPERIADAVEEFLRMYSPYRVFSRTATQTVEIRGRTIEAGESVALIFPSANRDEDMFPEPHKFDLDRSNAKRHVAFGRGPHQCVAAAMARLELRIAIEELLARTSSFELAGEVRMMNWLEFGPRSVPVRWIRTGE